jgi:hypothetical protein
MVVLLSLLDLDDTWDNCNRYRLQCLSKYANIVVLVSYFDVVKQWDNVYQKQS